MIEREELKHQTDMAVIAGEFAVANISAGIVSEAEQWAQISARHGLKALQLRAVIQARADAKKEKQ